MSNILLIGLILWAIFYFLMLRPKYKAQAQRRLNQQKISIGDWVILQSGMHACIADIRQDLIIVTAGATKMVFNKTAIVKLTTPPNMGELK